MIQIDIVTCSSPPAVNGSGKPPGAILRADEPRNDFKEVLKSKKSEIDQNEKPAASMTGEPVFAPPDNELQNKVESKTGSTDREEKDLSDDLSAEDKFVENGENSIPNEANAAASVQPMTEELVSAMMTVIVPPVSVDGELSEGTNTGVDAIATAAETGNTSGIDAYSNLRIANDTDPAASLQDAGESQIRTETAKQLVSSEVKVPGSEVSAAEDGNGLSSPIMSESVEENPKANLVTIYGRQETAGTLKQNGMTDTSTTGIAANVSASNGDAEAQTGVGQSGGNDAAFSSTMQQAGDVKAASQTGSNPVSSKQESNQSVSQTLLSKEQMTRIGDFDQSVLNSGLNASAVKPGNGLDTQVTQSPRITTAHLQQIAQEVNLSLQTGKSFARIQLHPQDLGMIDIKLSHDANGIGITIMTEQSSTGRLLEGQMENLRQSLADAGLHLTHMNFGMKEQTPQGERQFQQDKQMGANHNWYQKLWSGDENNQAIELPRLLSLGNSMIDYRV